MPEQPKGRDYRPGCGASAVGFRASALKVLSATRLLQVAHTASSGSAGAASRFADPIEEKLLVVFLGALSMACFIGAAVSFRRYDSKHFDLLVLTGVIFLSAAIPSFEVDSSLEELKSVNHRLLDIQSAIEKLQRR